ncbi:MAG: toxic anion resistance protein [Alphaproteobacteria bacterium]|nr:toxic anion resistance protein [Alphaproteobacteria bacterium]MBU2377623.1 toxic anion resistance protein [Alphaproteobacteria bacterium]
MGVSEALKPPSGGAPTPDPQRVATVRYAIVDEPEPCAGFAESARAALAELNDRALAETRTSDLGECAVLLGHVRDRVAALDPSRLQPRRGLAGLFDSRGGRLKAFRTAYLSAANSVGDASADIGDRGGAIARKGAALETLWSETRDAIAELDAHIAAARAWLANREIASVVEPAASPDPVVDETHGPIEAQADADAEHHAEPAPIVDSVVADTRLPDAVDPSASATVDELADAAPVAALPHPLETRLGALEAVRAVAIDRLPLLRAAQNADCRAPAALKAVCDGVEAWSADWRDALGLAGRKPKKVRPDAVRLTQASSALFDRISAADRDVAAARARRAELDARATPVSQSRLAA